MENYFLILFYYKLKFYVVVRFFSWNVLNRTLFSTKFIWTGHLSTQKYYETSNLSEPNWGSLFNKLLLRINFCNSSVKHQSLKVMPRTTVHSTQSTIKLYATFSYIYVYIHTPWYYEWCTNNFSWFRLHSPMHWSSSSQCWLNSSF